MYVCICNAVTEQAIREAAAGGIRSLDELTVRTGCAGTCGCCAELAEQILHDEHSHRAFPLPLLAAA